MTKEEVNFKRSKLFAAAWRGEFDDVQAIIDPCDIDINAKDDNGVTALRFTAQFGHHEITK
jgi:ankyrin repeat protein